METACAPQAAAPSAPPPANSRKRWFVPDLALVVSIATLLYCLVVFDGLRELLRDSDTGWHIRTGERIVRGEGLPHTDSYSLLKPGEPWFAWEWASDALMGLAHITGGLAGVTVVFAIAIATAAWLWFRLTWAVGGHFLIAGALTAPMLTTSQIHWHARPHVLSWLFFLAAVLYFERPKRRLWVVALGTVLWANFHASFFFAAVIALIYASGRFLRPLIWADTDRDAEWADARWFVKAAAVSVAATFITPYGWHLHQHLFSYLTNTELLSRIGEFHSFNFHSPESAQIMVALAVVVCGAVLAIGQRRIEHVLLIALITATGVRMARGLPMVALLGLPLANGAITAALRSASGLTDAFRKRLHGFLEYGDNLHKLDRGFAGPVAAAAVLALLFLALQVPEIRQRPGFSEKTFPVQAANMLEKLPRDIRLLAPDTYGGYLIYRFNGERKVFFDGRSDFYGAAFLKDYIDLVDVKPGWREKVEKIGFDHALLPKRYSLIPALETAGWKRLYSDSTAVLLQSPSWKGTTWPAITMPDTER
jgi:hypothetical protein